MQDKHGPALEDCFYVDSKFRDGIFVFDRLFEPMNDQDFVTVTH